MADMTINKNSLFRAVHRPAALDDGDRGLQIRRQEERARATQKNGWVASQRRSFRATGCPASGAPRRSRSSSGRRPRFVRSPNIRAPNGCQIWRRRGIYLAGGVGERGDVGRIACGHERRGGVRGVIAPLARVVWPMVANFESAVKSGAEVCINPMFLRQFDPELPCPGKVGGSVIRLAGGVESWAISR
jgi:hypothetical protein